MSLEAGFETLKTHTIFSLLFLHCLPFRMGALSSLLLLLLPSASGSLIPRNHKRRWALSSLSFLSHGVVYSNRKATGIDDDREHHTRCRRNLHLRHWLCLYRSEITCDINSLWEWMWKAFLHWQNLNTECKLLTRSDYYNDMQKRLTNQKIKAAFPFDKTAPSSFSPGKKKHHLQDLTIKATSWELVFIQHHMQ